MKDHQDNHCPLNIERAKFLELLNFDKNIARAEGSYLYTADGEKYLDFTSQYGAVPFGHNPEFLWDELLSQHKQSPGIMIQPFKSRGALALANELIEVAPGKPTNITFSCSGAEAIETAIKMARARTGRNKILSTLNGFHGKTMAASLATGNPYYREPFLCQNNDFAHIPYDDLAALEAALVSKEYAAFIVEPIQGEGGMIVPSPGYLKGCERLCSETGTLFVVDEIQVGLGRTGRLFACEAEDVSPDILVIAKALGGGMLPISACVANAKAWSKDFGQRHSSTFANNHLSAQIGLAVIRKLRSDSSVLDNVNTVGRYLKDQLNRLVAKFPKAFRSCSGEGFMLGLAIADWQDDEAYATGMTSKMGYAVPLVSSYLLNRHKIFTAPTLNASNVLRIQPNYLATAEQVDRLVAALEDVGALVTEGRFAEFFRAAIGLKPAVKAQKLRAVKNVIALPSGPKLGTFAFFMHPTTEQDATEGMPGGSEAYDEQETEKVINWIRQLKSVSSLAAPTYYMPCFPSKQGGYVDGWLISCPLTPREMMRLTKEEKAKLLNSYVKSAQSVNATMIGLGAFTSVISRSGLLVSDCGTPVTTGNAYTALTSTDSIRQLVQRSGRTLSELHLGIVGVSGSVGRLAMLDLGPDCKKISLIGNARNKTNHDSLEAVAGELLIEILGQTPGEYKSIRAELVAAGITAEHVLCDSSELSHADRHRQIYKRIKYVFERNKSAAAKFPITLTNEITQQLPHCDIVITATSNGEAFIKSECLARNAIICDVARPSDLTSEVLEQRDDVLAYEGGLVKLPAHLRFGGPNIVGLETGISLACLSETVILTMSQVQKNYSVGGVSSIAEARQVFQFANEHGFSTHIPQFDLTFRNKEKVYAVT